MVRNRIALLVAAVVLAVAAGCSSSVAPSDPTGSSRPAASASLGGTGSSAGSSAATSNAAPTVGTDQEVTFTAGGVTVHGSLRLPLDATGPVPAAVLAGSGPTDRNGNTPLVPGTIGTLSSLADVLAGDGVASLRYDKLGTGATGLAPYAANLAAIGYSDFVDEARAALLFLARRPGVDTTPAAPGAQRGGPDRAFGRAPTGP
jgi:hypothetical protein